MQKKTIAKFLIATVAATTLSFGVAVPAMAKNSTSQGGGVKCSWVLVSSANGSNVYQNVCRRSI